MILGETVEMGFDPNARGHRKAADVIHTAGVFRRNEVAKRIVRLPRWLDPLLAQMMKRGP